MSEELNYPEDLKVQPQDIDAGMEPPNLDKPELPSIEKEDPIASQNISISIEEYEQLRKDASKVGQYATKVEAATNTTDGAIKMLADALTKITNPEQEKVQIPLDDYLDPPRLYFAFTLSKNIFDDYKNGRAENVPYGKRIKFKTLYRTSKKMAGKSGSITTTMSAVAIHSKTVAEWLDNHSENGVTFFENIREAQSITSEIADKLITANNMVKQMNDFRVHKEAINRNLPIDTSDITMLRKMLTKKIADDLVRSDSRRNRSIVEKVFIHDSSSSKDGDPSEELENRRVTEAKTY